MFTIIICTYNGQRTIEKTLNHIYAQDEFDKYIEQVIVVDNVSTDNTSSMVKNYPQSKNLIYSYEAKPGLGNARLNGVRLANAEWTVFVDDDNELDANWISTAAKYIGSHPNVGVFGGSIIPKLEFAATQDEVKHLKKHMDMLACTDYSRDDIDFSREKSPFGDIVGAGMVVRTDCLKALAANGWIKQMGRTGNNTAAGDDGEISIFVTEKRGKKAGYCPYLILEHNLPQSRLQEDYLLRLNASLADGCYRGQSLKKLYVLRRVKQLVKYVTMKNPYAANTLEYKMWKQSKRIYIESVKRDRLFIRGN